jgi:hypothetical protein
MADNLPLADKKINQEKLNSPQAEPQPQLLQHQLLHQLWQPQLQAAEWQHLPLADQLCQLS